MLEPVLLKACSKTDGMRFLAQARQIFFDTAATKTFSSARESLAFLMRWFGNYAEIHPAAFLFALEGGAVAGYLAGCPDSFATVSNPITREIYYYTPSFRAALQSYPSHFHINVAPGRQGQGIGHALAAKFAAICAAEGSPGIHVVTSAASRAVKFYEGLGFQPVPPIVEADPGLAVLIRARQL